LNKRLETKFEPERVEAGVLSRPPTSARPVSLPPVGPRFEELGEVPKPEGPTS
jgi:hypothetical protein